MAPPFASWRRYAESVALSSARCAVAAASSAPQTTQGPARGQHVTSSGQGCHVAMCALRCTRGRCMHVLTRASSARVTWLQAALAEFCQNSRSFEPSRYEKHCRPSGAWPPGRGAAEARWPCHNLAVVAKARIFLCRSLRICMLLPLHLYLFAGCRSPHAALVTLRFVATAIDLW